MAPITASQGIRLLAQGIRNYLTKQPLVVSYEVTLSCNCNCRHCDLGGVIKDEKQIKPEDYASITRRLNPVAVQISGGEPLLRKDLASIVRAIKQPHGTPYVILVTNGVLLNEHNYLSLRQAGVNQFSVSLDFPDERHDEFRRHAGLYKHLEQWIPRLAKLGYRDIILNTAITRANVRELASLARKAIEWDVSISYSAYTPLRTGNTDYCISDKEDLNVLRRQIEELIKLSKQSNHIANPEPVLLSTLKFFTQGHLPRCKAGIRFLVVMPDGSLVPCSLHRIKYSSQKEMIEKFSSFNRCGGCYVAIRSYSEPQILGQLRNVAYYCRRFLSQKGQVC